jgi:hypothetical protein
MQMMHAGDEQLRGVGWVGRHDLFVMKKSWQSDGANPKVIGDGSLGKRRQRPVWGRARARRELEHGRHYCESWVEECDRVE